MRVNAGLVWTFAVLILIGYPFFTTIWAQALLGAGELPVDGDSIGIPIGISFVVAVMLSPIVLGISWFCLRRLNPHTGWLAWRRDRPFRSITGTVLFGVPALLLTSLVAFNTASGMDWHWYEHLWSGYAVLLVFWLLALPAAVIEQN